MGRAQAKKPLNFCRLMRLALAFFLSFCLFVFLSFCLSFLPSFLYSLPFFSLSSCKLQKKTHSFSESFLQSKFITLQSLFSSLLSLAQHIFTYFFNFSPSCFIHQQEKHQSTILTMFAKTALLCALFAASAQVAVAQAVVEPACFMKVFSYESHFNVKFAL